MTTTTRRTGAALLIAATLVGGAATACSNDEPTRASAAQTTSASTTTEPTASGVGKVTAPDQVGPYHVGRRSLTFTDPVRNRTLDVDVWYPVDPAVTGAPSRYSFLPTAYYDSAVALDSVPVSPAGPFPMVLNSHGSSGTRYVSAFFTETLASHGFVVVSADHAGNTALDEIAGTAVTDEQNEVNRLGDVTFVIDEMLRRNSTPDDPFAGSIDPDRIGAAGHSFGGFTVLAAPVGYSNSVATVPGDPRIKAVVAMAPYTDPISEEALAEEGLPTMLISGTKDRTTPVQPETERAWKHVSGRPLYRVDLLGGGHQSFSDVCQYQKMIPSLPDAPQVLIDYINDFAVEGCGPGLLDIDRAQSLINHFAISFLATHLAGTKGYEQLLTPSVANAMDDVKLRVER